MCMHAYACEFVCRCMGVVVADGCIIYKQHMSVVLLVRCSFCTALQDTFLIKIGQNLNLDLLRYCMITKPSFALPSVSKKLPLIAYISTQNSKCGGHLKTSTHFC